MESFEKLMPILFLIIWSLIAIMSKKKRRRAPASNKEKKTVPATPFDKLQNTLKDMFEELKQPVVDKLPETLKPEKTKIPETRKTRIEKEKEKGIEISDKTIRPLSPTTLEIKPSYEMYTRKRIKTSVPRKKLQEAVIWSEILAKPVSMRDE